LITAAWAGHRQIDPQANQNMDGYTTKIIFMRHSEKSRKALKKGLFMKKYNPKTRT
jgi:hypothetical protein